MAALRVCSFCFVLVASFGSMPLEAQDRTSSSDSREKDRGDFDREDFKRKQKDQMDSHVDERMTRGGAVPRESCRYLQQRFYK